MSEELSTQRVRRLGITVFIFLMLTLQNRKLLTKSPTVLSLKVGFYCHVNDHTFIVFLLKKNTFFPEKNSF